VKLSTVKGGKKPLLLDKKVKLGENKIDTIRLRAQGTGLKRELKTTTRQSGLPYALRPSQESQ